MRYTEKQVSKKELGKFVKALDQDEGIRIQSSSGMIFLNKPSKRYCIDIYNKGKDIFIYKSSPQQVLNFLKDKIEKSSKMFSY